MKVDDLREWLEGTGAEIIQTHWPVFFYRKDPFDLDPECDLTPFQGARLPEGLFEGKVQTVRVFNRDYARKHFGGKKIIAYDCADWLGEDGNEFPVSRMLIV